MTKRGSFFSIVFKVDFHEEIVCVCVLSHIQIFVAH